MKITPEIEQEVPRRFYENENIPLLINTISEQLIDDGLTMEEFDFCVAEIKGLYYRDAVIVTGHLK
ncbi:hypothetical protein JR334_01855 [Clostridia bacterium]|nr:hypothetical protein JR334_01855 [Clostridia bacterium]